MRFKDYSRLEDRVSYAESLAKTFKERGSHIDRKGSFPYQNIEDLKNSGYTSLTVPREYGGGGISLLELVMLQERIAEGDASTALSIGWHMGIIKNLSEKRLWKEDIFRKVCGDAVKNGALINSAASEKSTGSPARGGKPHTKAVKMGNGWLISGRKTFTTMSPALDYVLVSASLDGVEEIGTFLLDMKAKGISIEETWDSISMRGTGSHDLLLENAEAEAWQLVETNKEKKGGANGWLLHIPACYLGIASAAQAEAIDFAKNYSPNSIEGTIIELPTVRQKIGEMELLLVQSRHFLYSTARKWDEAAFGSRERMQPELSAVKMSVVNQAQRIVDLAMRLVGAGSLSEKSPMQRFYRDVRAGLHNPPMDEMTIELLAATAIKRRGDIG